MKIICHNSECHKEFEAGKNKRRKFCSISCSAKVNNKGVRRRGKPAGICLYCKKPKSRASCKFCSNACQQEYQYECYIKEWLAGKQTGYIGKKSEQVANPVKRWLKEQRGEDCEQCGWDEKNPVNDIVPLNIHHKDGDSRNCRPENLELLCPNCHSLTDTFGGLNNGNGRKNRYVDIV